MNDTRPKYMPDVQKVIRDFEPEAFEERRRMALQGAYDAGFVDRLTPSPDSQPPPARASAPSPWAKDGGAAAGIEKEALPSATGPAAEERPVTKAAVRAPTGWPATWKVVAAAGAVALGAPFLSLVLSRSMARTERAAATTAAAPATSTATLPSVEAVVTGAPSTAAPAGSATPSATASPPSATAIAPLAPPQRKPRGTPTGTRSDMDAGPLPPSRDTAEPATPPPPTQPAAAEPTATPPQTQIKF